MQAHQYSFEGAQRGGAIVVNPSDASSDANVVGSRFNGLR